MVRQNDPETPILDIQLITRFSGQRCYASRSWRDRSNVRVTGRGSKLYEIT
jgi:hypothetical protein